MQDGLRSLHPGPGDYLLRHDEIIVQFVDVDSLCGRDYRVAAGKSAML